MGERCGDTTALCKLQQMEVSPQPLGNQSRMRLKQSPFGTGIKRAEMQNAPANDNAGRQMSLG